MNKPRKHYSLIPALLQKTAADSTRWDITQAFAEKKNLTISFLNAYGLTNAIRNVEFYEFLYKGDYLLRDGIGVKLAMRFFNMPETANLNGTDLIPQILDQHKGTKIAIFGTKDEVLAICKQKLAEQGIKVSVLEHGFHPDEHYLQVCKKAKPAIIVLCMGMPRQELLGAYLRKQGYNGIIISGGGWADFYSGTVERAPQWVRKLSMEWLFRLYREPKRLWRRYTIDVVFFFYSITRARYLLLTKRKQNGPL